MADGKYYYDMDKANLIRLKVNRANMIQSLRVDDDLLSNLMKLRIIYYKEASEILQGRTADEKSKKLLDCLMSKKHARKDWYLQFRNLLLERNYKDVVVFLDSTIVKYKPKFVEKFCKTPTSQTNAPCYTDESQLTNSDSNFDLNKSKDLKNIYKIYSQKLKAVNPENLDEKNLDPLIENLPTYISKPFSLIADLQKTKEQEDAKQAVDELEEFESFCKLEILYSIYMADPESLNGSLFLDTQIAYKLLNSSNTHMHIKYYTNLLVKFEIDLLKFLKDCLVSCFKSGKIIRLRLFKSLDELVYKLSWILLRNEKYEYTAQLLEEFLNYLDFIENYLSKINIENNNLQHETLTSLNSLLIDKFNTYSLLSVTKLNLFEFDKSAFLIEKTNNLIEVLNKSK